jgi:hypothetical protein
MAVDRKADHVGDHGGRYTDIDGASKQFTYVDHDKKTRIGVSSNTPFNKEWEYLESAVKDHPLFEVFLNENGLTWGENVNLGHLRQVKALIDGTAVQREGVQTVPDQQNP